MVKLKFNGCFTQAMHRDDVLYSNFLSMNFLSNHDTTRIASRLNDPAHVPLALTLLTLLRGMPCLYYGDELGLKGKKEVSPSAPPP